MAPSKSTIALVSGAAAGLSVDVALFPLDTIKTRLQSSQGFLKAGGFRGIYAGLQTAAIGSVPGAAAFFLTYETAKAFLAPKFSPTYQPVVHMLSAASGEVIACLVRVPCEVVKQRAQASAHRSQVSILKAAVQAEGILGLYRGYFSTVMREIPFSFIQFPLWELLKSSWARRQNKPADPWQSAVCGAVAGGLSAAVTTPLDVAKTRIMLAESGSVLAGGSIAKAIHVIYTQKGVTGLFAGATARVPWIAVGGFIFLGVYDKSRDLLTSWSR